MHRRNGEFRALFVNFRVSGRSLQRHNPWQHWGGSPASPVFWSKRIKNGLDTVTLLQNNIFEFCHYSWEKTISVKEFVVDFHSRLAKASKLDMHDELKFHLLLEQVNLGDQDRNLVGKAAVEDYSPQVLATSLQDGSRTEGFLPGSINKNRPRPYPSIGATLK